MERLLLGFKGYLEDINVIVSPVRLDEFVALYILIKTPIILLCCCLIFCFPAVTVLLTGVKKKGNVFWQT